MMDSKIFFNDLNNFDWTETDCEWNNDLQGCNMIVKLLFSWKNICRLSVKYCLIYLARHQMKRFGFLVWLALSNWGKISLMENMIRKPIFDEYVILHFIVFWHQISDKHTIRAGNRPTDFIWRNFWVICSITIVIKSYLPLKIMILV